MSLANTPGTFDLGNLTGARHQVIHRQCGHHDLAYVPGVGFRTVTIMMRTGLFPFFRSRNKDCLPKPPGLFSTLSNTFLQSMQLPGLRLPTLEEVMKETHARCGATAEAASSKVAVDVSSQAEEAPARAQKRRRIKGKTHGMFA